jgi:chaperonin GroES
MIETAAVQISNLDGEVESSDYPVPVGWRLLIEPIKVEEKTASGLVLPEQAIAAKEHLRYIGRVVAMGHLCYQHQKFVGADGAAIKWCKVGDYVAHGAYAGQEIKVRDKSGHRYVSLKLLNDDEVLAVIPRPESVLIYC